MRGVLFAGGAEIMDAVLVHVRTARSAAECLARQLNRAMDSISHAYRFQLG